MRGEMAWPLYIGVLLGARGVICEQDQRWGANGVHAMVESAEW